MIQVERAHPTLQRRAVVALCRLGLGLENSHTTNKARALLAGNTTLACALRGRHRLRIFLRTFFVRRFEIRPLHVAVQTLWPLRRRLKWPAQRWMGSSSFEDRTVDSLRDGYLQRYAECVLVRHSPVSSPKTPIRPA
jgi:hypothetical protein